MADRVNADGRRTAERCGMPFFPQYSLRWARVLAPGKAAAAALLNRRGNGASASAASVRAVGRAGDLVIGRMAENYLQFKNVPGKLNVKELSAADLVAQGDAVLARFRVRPDFSTAEHIEVQWRWLEFLRPEGRVHRVGIWTKYDELVAWYLLHVWPSGTAEVVQLATTTRFAARTLGLLFDHASRLGVASLHGNAHPSLLLALSDVGAIFHGRGAGFGVQTSNPDLLAAFEHGDAYVTGLDGEYPLQLSRLA